MNLTSHHNLIIKLDTRRKELGLSCAFLAKQTGLSLRTVQRALAGQKDPAFATILAIAEHLGLVLRFEEKSIDVMRRQQARQKAKKFISVLQATSALEAQAVTDETLRSLEERTIIELLAGSRRRLWAD